MQDSPTSPARWILNPDQNPSEPERHEVEQQLGRMLSDPLFSSSKRLSRFLRFVVDAVLDEHADELKEYLIGVEVFELGHEYSPQENPVVRIMAGRLRSKIAEYYLTSGSLDPVLIDIPKGGYAARFARREIRPMRHSSSPQPTRSIPPNAECVGREQQLAALRAAFHSERRAGGSIWVLSGEAGIGKTTLAETFLAFVEDEEPRAWIARGRGSERLADTDAFVPVLDALHSLLRGQQGTQAAELMRVAAPDWYEEAALGSQSPPRAFRAASFEKLRRQIIDLAQAFARTAPVIWFLDDLQWSDASTCDLLKYVGARIRELPIFLILAYRPSSVRTREDPFLNARAALQRSGVCSELELPFLAVDQVSEYLSVRFPNHSFPEELARAVYKRTEGNPLFVRDVVGYLLNRGAISSESGIWRLNETVSVVERTLPNSIRELIRMELERLSEADVDLLKCAAVQGAEFDSAVLATALAIAPIHVEELLQQLAGRQSFIRLVAERHIADKLPSLRYRFIHVLYQNTLYDSLGPSRRAEYSRAVAHALMTLTGGRIRDAAGEVAFLFEAAHEADLAATYFYHAARNAASLSAYPEAALTCERGLRALLSTPPSPARHKRELSFLLVLGVALMATRGYAAAEVEQLYRRALELCMVLNDKRRIMQVLWALHTCEVNAGRLEASLSIAEDMRRAVETDGGDEAGMVECLHALGSTLGFMGRFQEAKVALEKIFSIRKDPAPGLVVLLDSHVTSLAMYARALAYLGLLDQAITRALAALRRGEQLDHPQTIAYGTFWVGWVHQMRGEFEASRDLLERAMAMSRDQELALIFEWSRVVHGSVLAQLGQIEPGVAEMRESIARQQAMRSLLERSYCLTVWAQALGKTGAVSDALVLCDEAILFAKETHGQSYEPEAHRVRGELLLRAGGASASRQAELAFRRSLEIAGESGSKTLALRAAMSYFRLHRSARSEHARAVLSTTLASFGEGLDCPQLQRASELLGNTLPGIQ